MPVIAGYLSVEGYRDARYQQKITKFGPGSRCDAEHLANYWGLKQTSVARFHTLVVVIISGLAIRSAIEPYWPEIYRWTEDVIRTRTLDQILP